MYSTQFNTKILSSFAACVRSARAFKLLFLKNKMELKGAVSRDVLPFFLFHEKKPSGPLINRLKWFCLKIRFHEIFAKNSTLHRLSLRGDGLCAG